MTPMTLMRKYQINPRLPRSQRRETGRASSRGVRKARSGEEEGELNPPTIDKGEMVLRSQVIKNRIISKQMLRGSLKTKLRERHVSSVRLPFICIKGCTIFFTSNASVVPRFQPKPLSVGYPGLIEPTSKTLNQIDQMIVTCPDIHSTPQPWPAQVKCDMNIAEWKHELESYDLMREYGFLLKGFEEGFHQGIPEHTLEGMDWYCPPNHSSALQVKDKIVKNIDKEVQAKRMFGPFAKQHVHNHLGFFRTSPLGAVENGDKSFRPINDLSYPRNDPDIPLVNSFVRKGDFTTTWDDFKIVAKLFRNLSGEYLLGIFDWEGAYRQIPTHPTQWRYLAICDFMDNVYIDTRIAFGGVAGCGSFGGPADGWKCIMQAKFRLYKILRWVDDNLCIKDISNQTSMMDIVRASERLGVKTNSTKYAEFADQQAFIGFIWNIKDRTVSLSATKLLQRRQALDEFWEKQSWKKNELEKINGKLNHLTLILPQLRAYLSNNFRWLASWTRPVHMKAPRDVLDDMSFWRTDLTTLKPTRLIPDTVEWNIGWVGDASTEYGIGVIVGTHWAQFKWKEGWNTPKNGPKRSIAWAETVAIRLGLLMVTQLHQVAGRTLSCLSDNTTTNSVVDRLRSRDFWVNEEWKTIQRMLIGLDCSVKTHYVWSKDNEADCLLRGIDPSKDKKRCLLVPVPEDLLVSLEQVFP